MLGSTEKMNRAKFTAVFAHSTPNHTPHLLIRTSASDTDKSHGAVVVSKRIARSSVARNRIRRRIYNILNEFFPTFSSPRNVIVVAKRGSDTASFLQLKEELQNSLGGK